MGGRHSTVERGKPGERFVPTNRQGGSKTREEKDIYREIKKSNPLLSNRIKPILPSGNEIRQFTVSEKFLAFLTTILKRTL